MRKILVFSGIGLLAFASYRYFKYQINLALAYGYKIKSVKLGEMTDKYVDVDIVVEIINKSSFEILVRGYDISLSYKGVHIIDIEGSEIFKIMPNNSFELRAKSRVDLEKSKGVVLPFVKDVLSRKPVNLEVSGVVKFKFMGIYSTANLNNQSFEYSSDLLKEYGADKVWEKLVTKYPKIVKFLEINK